MVSLSSRLWVMLMMWVVLWTIRSECRREPFAGLAEAEMRERKECSEIYVVGKGETLQTISTKCGDDAFSFEENPYVKDEDDVYPGLVIKLIYPTTTIGTMAHLLPRNHKPKLVTSLEARPSR